MSDSNASIDMATRRQLEAWIGEQARHLGLSRAPPVLTTKQIREEVFGITEQAPENAVLPIVSDGAVLPRAPDDARRGQRLIFIGHNFVISFDSWSVMSHANGCLVLC